MNGESFAEWFFGTKDNWMWVALVCGIINCVSYVYLCRVEPIWWLLGIFLVVVFITYFCLWCLYDYYKELKKQYELYQKLKETED